MLEKIIEKAQKENKKVYIYAHKTPDGDALGSACAVVEYFKNKGIDAQYVITNPIYSFSQIVGDIQTTSSVDENSISLILDTSTLDYAENTLFESSSVSDIFVIDHHGENKKAKCIEVDLKVPKKNVIRNPMESSTCEMILDEIRTRIDT